MFLTQYSHKIFDHYECNKVICTSFELGTLWVESLTCVDPESFVRLGPALATFHV